jgi:hypothetical protein
MRYRRLLFFEPNLWGKKRALVILGHLSPRLIPIQGLALALDDPFINRLLVKSPDPSNAYRWDLTIRCVLADGNLVQL